MSASARQGGHKKCSLLLAVVGHPSSWWALVWHSDVNASCNFVNYHSIHM